jgi:hypothetical protein
MPLFHGAINHALKRTIKREKIFLRALSNPGCLVFCLSLFGGRFKYA